MRFDNLDIKYEEEEWKNFNPDDNYNSSFDGQLRKIDRRACNRIENNNNQIRKFIPDNVEIETDNKHFTLKKQLVTHYKVARQRNLVRWI